MLKYCLIAILFLQTSCIFVPEREWNDHSRSWDYEQGFNDAVECLENNPYSNWDDKVKACKGK